MRLNQFISSIPGIIRIGSIVLVGFTLVFTVYMRYEAYRLKSWAREFLKTLSPFRGDRTQTQTGITPTTYEQIRSAAVGLKSRPAVWWEHIEASMELYTSPEENDSWFVTRPIRDVLSFEDLIGNSYHQSFHSSVPGILTGIGLSADVCRHFTGAGWGELSPDKCRRTGYRNGWLDQWTFGKVPQFNRSLIPECGFHTC